jgi:hypothetical protein
MKRALNSTDNKETLIDINNNLGVFLRDEADRIFL